MSRYPTLRQRGFGFYAAMLTLYGLYGLVQLVPLWRLVGQFCFEFFDFGLYTEAIAKMHWHSLNPWLDGRQVHVFNDHFDPILLVSQPFTLFLSPPHSAIITEATMTVAGTVPLLRLRHGGWLNDNATWLLCAIVLFNASISEALYFPVHPTTWAAAPMLLLFAGLVANRPTEIFVGLIVLMCCKEEFPFVGVMLAAALAWERRPRMAAAALVLSLAWLGFVFGVRPLWMGPTIDYGPRFTQGFLADPSLFIAERLRADGMASRLGSIALIFAPVVIWARRAGAKVYWPYALLLAPPLALRFLGMNWRYHYGPPLVAGGVGICMFLLQRRPVPRWLCAVSAVLLMSCNTNGWKLALQTVWASHTAMSPRCSPDAARLGSIADGLAYVREHPGAVLAAPHFTADLAGRPEVYAMGAPRPVDAVFRFVFFELQSGWRAHDPRWGVLHERLAVWRTQSETRVIRDDGWVFLAEGAFLP